MYCTFFICSNGWKQLFSLPPGFDIQVWFVLLCFSPWHPLMIKIQSCSNPESFCILAEVQKQRRNGVQPADTKYFNVRITAALEIMVALKVEEQGNEIHCWRTMSIMKCAETDWKQLTIIWKSRFISLSSSPTWFAELVSSHCSHLASQMLSLSHHRFLLISDSYFDLNVDDGDDKCKLESQMYFAFPFPLFLLDVQWWWSTMLLFAM